MPSTPYVIEQTSRGERSYDVYSRLLKDRTIFLGTPIDAEVANVLVAQLLLLDSQSSEQAINLFINCPGGDVYAGLAIYDTMQFVGAPVNTTCVGTAMSMGSIILMAGAQGGRAALPHSRVMIHQGSAGFPRSSLPDLEVQASEFMLVRDMVLSLYEVHTGQERDKVLQDMTRDFYLSAEQAKDYGLIDQIVEPRSAGRFSAEELTSESRARGA